MDSYSIVNTVSRQSNPYLQSSQINGLVENTNVLVTMMSSGVSYAPVLRPATLVDVIGTIYFTIQGIYVPEASRAIDNITIYLPVPANQSAFSNASVAYNALTNQTNFIPQYTFKSDFPIVDDTSTPTATSPGILTYDTAASGVFVLKVLPTFTADTTKDITGSVIYPQLQ